MTEIPKTYKNLEIDLALQDIFSCYGYDFNGYSLAPIKRSLYKNVLNCSLGCIAELIPKIIHDEDFFKYMLKFLLVGCTDSFRDPCFYKSIEDNVIQYLKTYPFLNWQNI